MVGPVVSLLSHEPSSHGPPIVRPVGPQDFLDPGTPVGYVPSGPPAPKTGKRVPRAL